MKTRRFVNSKELIGYLQKGHSISRRINGKWKVYYVDVDIKHNHIHANTIESLRKNGIIDESNKLINP